MSMVQIKRPVTYLVLVSTRPAVLSHHRREDIGIITPFTNANRNDSDDSDNLLVRPSCYGITCSAYSWPSTPFPS
ncbi:hypothetical protein BDR07DRAFT_1417871 [Suillus spraguei]|nr:hypothetical protein BDR07DRAFT_1417871 [Suillus spraguei]